MKIPDYDIIRNILNHDENFSSFLENQGDKKSVAMLMHMLSEKYEYSQVEAFRIANLVLKQLNKSIVH